jgi:divalent anion:Na+ symporter, DASS family
MSVKKILIIGAGSIGTVIGASLVQAGLEVTFVGRSQSNYTKQIKQSGITLFYPSGEKYWITPDNPKVRFVDTTEKLEEIFDVIFVAVKSDHLASAASYIRNHSDQHTLIFHAQNGIPYWWFADNSYFTSLNQNLVDPISSRRYLDNIDPDGKILDLLSDRYLIGCVVKAPCCQIKLGDIEVKKPPKMLIGLVSSQQDHFLKPAVEQLCEILSAYGLETTYVEKSQKNPQQNHTSSFFKLPRLKPELNFSRQEQDTVIIGAKNNKFSSSISDNFRLLILLVMSIFNQRFSLITKINTRQIYAVLLSILLGCIFWFMPSPDGIDEQGWHLLAIFLATIVSFITKPLPFGTIAMSALVMCVLTNTLELDQSLSGFSSSTSWLTLSSFLIARAIIKTGLAVRIAYLFMSFLGKNTLALSYGLLATDLVLSPGVPSGNARAAGIIFPIVKSLASIYRSEPHDGTAGKIGTFLMQTGYQGTQITTSMFLTAMVANPFMAEFAAGMGVEIDWTTWALAACIPGILCLLVMPIIVFLCSPPELKKTPEATEMAKNKLVEMGKVKRTEWFTVAILITLLLLWTFGNRLLGIESTTTALFGIILLLFTDVLTWNDIVQEKKAWDIFIWFSVLLMLAGNLYQLGVVSWVSESFGQVLGGLAWQPAFIIFSLVSFYNSYFFASKTALVSAMYPALLPIALSFGTPPIYAALILAGFMNLSGCLSPYATSEAPVYFGAGYISTSTWYKVGFSLSLVYIPVWLGIGGIWWHILGLF